MSIADPVPADRWAGQASLSSALTIALVGGTCEQVQAATAELLGGHPDASGCRIITVGLQGDIEELDRSNGDGLDGERLDIPGRERAGWGVWDWAFRPPVSGWVLCLAPDVRLEPNALSRLLEFIAAHPDCGDLLQGPLVPDASPGVVSRELQSAWRDGVLGVPVAEPDEVAGREHPIEVGLQDLGLFCCRVEGWPGLNPRLSGSAGHEGYLHKKFQAAGRRTLCLPFLRWRRVSAAADTAPEGGLDAMRSRLRDLLWQWSEVGMATEPLIDHYAELIGPRAVDEVVASWERELANPFSVFDAIVCLNLDSQPHRWQTMLARFEPLGIADRVQRISAVVTPGYHHVGCALSHRKALEYAHQRGLNNILIFEDDAVFLHGATWVMRRALHELRDRPWNALYLGGHRYYIGDARTLRPVPGGSYLERADGLICAHALAFSRETVSWILAELPATEADMVDWIAANGYIDLFYAQRLTDAYRTVPVVASQEAYAAVELADLRDQFAVVANDLSRGNGASGGAAGTGSASRTSDLDGAYGSSPAARFARPGPADPRLDELRRRYRNHVLQPDSIQRWGRDARRNIDFREFRDGTGPYTRIRSSPPPGPQGGKDRERAYAAYVENRDSYRILDLLDEDGAFGSKPFQYRDRTVSFDLLDSANELGFLFRTGLIAEYPELAVVDIGAGYGRLAHRATEAIGGLSRYVCLDAVPESTYLAEFYLEHRGVLGSPVDVIPLDELNTLRGSRFDLAVAVRAFSEMDYASVTAWLDLITELAVPNLLIATFQEHFLYTSEGGHERYLDFAGYLRGCGYHLVHEEPTVADRAAADLVERTGHFLLYQR